MKQHIINVHSQSPGVPCDVCQKVVKNKWYLRKHQVTAHGAPLKRKKGEQQQQQQQPTAVVVNNDDEEEEEIVVDNVDTEMAGK